MPATAPAPNENVNVSGGYPVARPRFVVCGGGTLMKAGKPVNEYVMFGAPNPGSGFVLTVTFCGAPPMTSVSGFGIAVAVNDGCSTMRVTLPAPALLFEV